ACVTRTGPWPAAKMRKRRVGSAVRSRPPAVGVTDATIEVSVSYFQMIFPVSASTAVTCPNRWSGGSCSPKPFVDPIKGFGGSYCRLSGPPSLIVVAQSIEGTKRRLSAGEYVGQYQFVR